ncbi:MAG: AraC family transcriptional regulator [Myxococcales bacterium]
MAAQREHEKVSLSVRFFWPFIRTCGADPRYIRLLFAENLNFEELRKPDARVPHATTMRLLANIVAVLGDPQLGLKAGRNVQLGDMDALEFAARSCRTMREAAHCVSRYHRIMHNGAEVELHEEKRTATWRYRLLYGLREHPAAHDFMISYLKSFVFILFGRDEPLTELFFAHEDRTNLSEYERLFRCPVTFGCAYTGCSFPVERLDWPMPQADRELNEVFEEQAKAQLREAGAEVLVSTLARAALLRGMAAGVVEMGQVAQSLSISESTLRRRLKDEGTTLSELLDEVRKARAIELLTRPDVASSEISFLLCFSDSAAFFRAFKRWTGMTPSEYRTSLKR